MVKPKAGQVGGSSAGRDIRVEKNSEFTGRDHTDITYGLTAAELDKLLDVVSRHFPNIYKSPEALDQQLASLEQCQNELIEWKELHNFLDTILQSFDQFEREVHQASPKNPNPSNLWLTWFPISKLLEQLIDWTTYTMRIIEPNQVPADTSGPRKAPRYIADMAVKSKDITAHLIHGKQCEEESRSGNLLQRLTARTLEQDWCDKLRNLTSEYGTLALQNMHLADDKLRKAADRLDKISRSAAAR